MIRLSVTDTSGNEPWKEGSNEKRNTTVRTRGDGNHHSVGRMRRIN
jgi:hypothetical protein